MLKCDWCGYVKPRTSFSKKHFDIILFPGGMPVKSRRPKLIVTSDDDFLTVGCVVHNARAISVIVSLASKRQRIWAHCTSRARPSPCVPQSRQLFLLLRARISLRCRRQPFQLLSTMRTGRNGCSVGAHRSGLLVRIPNAADARAYAGGPG